MREVTKDELKLWVKGRLQDLLDEAKHPDEPAGRIALEVLGELAWARNEYAPMHSPHEGYAVLLEEMGELWDEVKVKDDRRDVERMREEAIQVAAMAIRFVLDVCGG